MVAQPDCRDLHTASTGAVILDDQKALISPRPGSMKVIIAGGFAGSGSRWLREAGRR